MPEPVAYLNGSFIPQVEARLALHDAGFVFGATVTDLCRTFHHRLFRLSDHLARFRQNCSYCRVPQPLPDDELERIVQELVSRNAALLRPELDLALVLFATPGPIGYYAGLPGGVGSAPPTLGMHTFPLPFARYIPLFQHGAHLVVPATRHVPSTSVDPRVKQRSRLHWWLAEQEAHEVDPQASALLLDADDHVTETAAANFLVVRQGTVFAPPRSSILDGISLRTIEEFCQELGIPLEERPLTLDDCLHADEALLCSSSFCLAGVSRINATTIPWPGRIFRQLLESWSKRVNLDIRQQILSNP